MANLIARHHVEWLSLLETSGPFLSIDVLMATFRNGLDADDGDLRRAARDAWNEWRDNQLGVKPDPDYQAAWVRYVLTTLLGMPNKRVLRGDAIPSDLSISEPLHGEVVRPNFVVTNPDGTPRLPILVEPAGQRLDKSRPGRSWTVSPTDRLIAFLRGVNLPLGIVTNGEEWQLVHAPRDVTTSTATWYAELWFEEPLTLRACRSLLGASRFFGVPDEETIEAMLARSVDAQQEVTHQLGSQVRTAIEQLVQAIDLANRDAGGSLLVNVSEATVYRAATTIMMRLVFLFSAEERHFFPLEDELYYNHYAATPLREQLRKFADDHTEQVMERRSDAWHRLLATFRAIHNGVAHERLRLPAYGGHLFDPDRFPFLEGRAEGTSWKKISAHPLPINNRVILHVLESLQLLQVRTAAGEVQTRRLSYRGLDVEQIGDVYEGLLDHDAVRADAPVLGLAGTRGKEPELKLSDLEDRAANRVTLLDWLKEQTGRSVNALGRALDSQLDVFEANKLRVVCGGDEALVARVLPWAGLLRKDIFDRPVLFLPGSIFVTRSGERRASGTHYTPRALAEPIVRHTLEPLVYVGPAEGKPEAEWLLKPPEALLALKICDMAMGSGAFLVAVVRYLSERIVEAWAQAETCLAIDHRRTWLDQEGASTRNHNHALPADTDERKGLAARLVAERCIYGVDKNADAVELAKLALWLITLDAKRPFTFVDHALKSGDSLVGIHTLDQLRCWNLEGSGARAFGTLEIDKAIGEMIAVRQQIETRVVQDVEDQEIKALLLADAEARAHDLKSAADHLIASYYNTLKPTQQKTLRSALLSVARDGANLDAQWQPHGNLGDLKPFHWPLEFPEVFVAEGRTGFDAFVGNPPFLGGMKISTSMGVKYLQLLQAQFGGSNGTADFCAYFFVRAFGCIEIQGYLGLIATNTIGQGDTRRVGLDRVLAGGGVIYRAKNDLRWSGNASVVVAIVHICRGIYQSPHILDGEIVRGISSQLDDELVTADLFSLLQNSNRCFVGSYLWGIGFALDTLEAQSLLKSNSENAQVIFPFIGGNDINTSPTHSPSRYVINFFDWPRERREGIGWFELSKDAQEKELVEAVVPSDYPGRVASDFADVFQIVKERVYPGRQKIGRESNRRNWWLYGEKRPALYAALVGKDEALVIAQVTKYVSFAFVPTGYVYSHKLIVFPTTDRAEFSIFQSSVFDQWTRQHTSTLGSAGINFSPSDCVAPFPFPVQISSVRDVGGQYEHHRGFIMRSRNEGLTATYNRFHLPTETSDDIAHLRALHVEMDNAVVGAYGWGDLELGHGFRETPQGMRYTISEVARREVLRRLLALNHERYAEEVAQGLHEKKKGKRSAGKGAKKLKANDHQISFDME